MSEVPKSYRCQTQDEERVACSFGLGHDGGMQRRKAEEHEAFGSSRDGVSGGVRVDSAAAAEEASRPMRRALDLPLVFAPSCTYEGDACTWQSIDGLPAEGD